MFWSLSFFGVPHKITCPSLSFFFFSRPKQKFSAGRLWGWGPGWSPERGQQALCHIPYRAKTTAIGVFAVTLKWCEASCFVRSPTEGEIEGALWKPPLEVPAPAQEMTSLQELCGYCKGLCFGFLFLNSLWPESGICFGLCSAYRFIWQYFFLINLKWASRKFH